MDDKETLDHIWKWTHAMLKEAESNKWDNTKSHDVRRYHQGVADTLRKELLLLRDNPRIVEEFADDWRGTVGGTGRADPDYLCPDDGSVMRFLFQSRSERRYKCTTNEHGWAFDWRGTWDRA